MKRIAIGLIALLLVLGTLYYFSTRAVSQEYPISPILDGPVTATIHFTDEGFEPAVVTIRKNEAVRWVNDASTDTWPASGVHPTHSLYPQKSVDDCLGSSFDACAGLAPGASWEFTFIYPGTWRFHDHLDPTRTGIVNVTE